MRVYDNIYVILKSIKTLIHALGNLPILLPSKHNRMAGAIYWAFSDSTETAGDNQ